MRLNRDGTMQQDGEETRITRFAYKNKNVTIGGVMQVEEMEVDIVGEFDRMVAITKNETCMCLPPKEALKLAHAIIRAARRAKGEQKHMDALQAADDKRLDLKRLKELSNRPVNQSELGELERLRAKYK